MNIKETTIIETVHMYLIVHERMNELYWSVEKRSRYLFTMTGIKY